MMLIEEMLTNLMLMEDVLMLLLMMQDCWCQKKIPNQKMAKKEQYTYLEKNTGKYLINTITIVRKS